MRNRFLVTIAAVGCAGLLLLSLRQQRIAVIHDMSTLHRTLDADRARLWAVRADVAARVRPGMLTAEPGDDWTAAVPLSRDVESDDIH